MTITPAIRHHFARNVKIKARHYRAGQVYLRGDTGDHVATRDGEIFRIVKFNKGWARICHSRREAEESVIEFTKRLCHQTRDYTKWLEAHGFKVTFAP